jgi:hypothetical protein
MSTPLDDQLAAALADLRVQQTRIRTVTEEVSKATANAASKDRAIEATVDSQGKLTGLKLKGTAYRKLAPAELAARIVDTVRSAQDSAVRQTMDTLSGLLPAGMGLDLGSGLTLDRAPDIDGLFDAAVRLAQEPFFTDKATGPREDADHG